jgi:hypothetical protein
MPDTSIIIWDAEILTTLEADLDCHQSNLHVLSK